MKINGGISWNCTTANMDEIFLRFTWKGERWKLENFTYMQWKVIVYFKLCIVAFWKENGGNYLSNCDFGRDYVKYS